MSFFTSSIGRKVVMSITGLFLISFLIVHLAVNLLTLVGKDLFNEASHFMGTNPFIQVMQYVLALGFILHISQGLILTMKNRQARPQKYAMNKPETNSGISSRSMLMTGLLVLLFIIIHLRDYFWEMKFGDLGGYETDYDLVVGLFDDPIYTAVYVLSFILLAFHLNHGFQSAFQSIGASHPKYTPILKTLSTVFCIVVGVGFSAISLYFFFN